MTNSSLNRFDCIETTLEVVTQAQVDFAQSLNQLTHRVDRIAGQVDRVVGQFDQVVAHIGTLAESQRTLIDNQRTLIESQRSLAESMEQMTSTVIPRMRENQASTGAAIERLDRILDYLIRRDQDRQP